jgi:DNA-binding MarR family transcriptional regulator
MSEVAEALIMTRGGLTKLFDRLEAAGLVSRAACPTDRRSVYAVIEKPGRNVLEEMRPIVTRELDAVFVSRVSPAEARTIAEALERARGSACSAE